MDGDTLVIEKAASVLLLTRIEPFTDYSEPQVEALRQAVEQLTPDYAVLLERARKVQSEMLNRDHRGFRRRFALRPFLRGASR